MRRQFNRLWSALRRPWPAVAAGVLAVAAGVLLTVAVWWWSRPAKLTIGIEGSRSIEIVGPLREAAPFTPGDALSVRVAAATPTARGFLYDLRFIAYGPGQHDLRDAIFRPGEVRPGDAPSFFVHVDSILPADQGGELFDTEQSPISLHSNYSVYMRLLWGLWGLMLVPILLRGRRRRVAIAPAVAPPSTGERIESLLRRAVGAQLSPEQQAELERLLLAFWSRQTNITAERLADTVAQLRRQPTVGEQMQRVEIWLHRRDAAEGDATARALLHELGPELRRHTAPVSSGAP